MGFPAPSHFQGLLPSPFGWTLSLGEEDSDPLPASPSATPTIPFHDSSWPNLGLLASGLASV